MLITELITNLENTIKGKQEYLNLVQNPFMQQVVQMNIDELNTILNDAHKVYSRLIENK
jgi:hypothetical protein